MSHRRQLRVPLALIAVAIPISMLILFELGSPVASAEVGPGTAASEPTAEPGASSPAAASSLPLRWRVAYARHRVTTATNCGTVVMVQNLAPTATDVQLEFFNNLGGSQKLDTVRSLPAGDQWSWRTDNDINFDPFVLTAFDMNLGVAYSGYVFVHADDPRIQATAYIVCRTDDSSEPSATILSTTNVPTFPVGQTLSLFQAGRPGAGPGPPLAEPGS